MAAVEYLKRSLLCSLHTVFKRKWLYTCIGAVNDSPLCHAQFIIYYGTIQKAQSKKEKTIMLSAPERKHFCYYFEKSRNSPRKSYTFTVTVWVKTRRACLDLSLSISVCDECAPLGSARTRAGVFRMHSTSGTVPATGNGIFQLS